MTLLNTLSFMKEQNYNGVQGYMCIDTGKTGPTLGITALTHGNEYAGLAAIQYIIDNAEKILCGRIILGINNIDAAEEKKRCLRTNMNRLPEDIKSNTSYTDPEIIRAQEILPATREFDIALDIHSTKEDSTPILLDITGGAEVFYAIFNVNHVIQNIAKKQIGLPLCAFYGKDSKKTLSLGYEAGKHTEDIAYKNAIIATKRMLIALGMAEKTQEKEETLTQNVYKVVETIVLPKGAVLSKPRKGFAFIKEGEVLATYQEKEVTMPLDGYNFLGISEAKENEESFFLLQKVS